jgi:hypothetical protein
LAAADSAMYARKRRRLAARGTCTPAALTVH